MKVVILAGGLGTRLSEETVLKPKPLVEIGGKPILDHIMRWYAHHGFNEFIIALGYKGEQIKSYFLNYYAFNSNITVSLRDGNAIMTKETGTHDDWTVQLVDTGLHTQTGGRIAQLKSRITEDTFMLTYGDGLSNVDLNALLSFHHTHGKKCTLTAVRPPSRFGALEFQGDQITNFVEKPPTGEVWINGGFFVVNRSVLDDLDPISQTNQIWERGPLETLALQGELMAYKHIGFWQAMDSLREKHMLEELWSTGNAPWRT